MMEAVDFSKALAKRLQGLKREIGAISVQGSYKGIGRQAHRRQIIVKLATERWVDLWIERDRLEFGGVYRTRFALIPTADQNLDRIFSETCAILKTISG